MASAVLLAFTFTFVVRACLLVVDVAMREVGGADKVHGWVSWVFSSFIRVCVCICCPSTWPSDTQWVLTRFVGGFAGFLVIDVGSGLGYLSWVVSEVVSWQGGG